MRFIGFFILLISGSAFASSSVELYRQFGALKAAEILESIISPNVASDDLQVTNTEISAIIKDLPRNENDVPVVKFYFSSATEFIFEFGDDMIDFDFKEFEKRIVYVQGHKLTLPLGSNRSYQSIKDEVHRMMSASMTKSAVIWNFIIQTSFASPAVISKGNVEAYVAGLFTTLSRQYVSYSDSKLSLEDYLIQDAVRSAKSDQRINSRVPGHRAFSYTTFKCSGSKLGYFTEYADQLQGSETDSGIQRELVKTSTGYVLRDAGFKNRGLQLFGVTIVTDANGTITEDRSMKVFNLVSRSKPGYHPQSRSCPELLGLDNIPGQKFNDRCILRNAPKRYETPITLYGTVGSNIFTGNPFTEKAKLAEECCATAGCYQKVSEALNYTRRTVRENPTGKVNQ